MINLNLFKKNIFILLAIIVVTVIGCDNQSEKANLSQIVFPETKEDTLEDLTQQLMDNPESPDSEIPEESLESIVEKLDESEKEEE